jgi:hypothetical protein
MRILLATLFCVTFVTNPAVMRADTIPDALHHTRTNRRWIFASATGSAAALSVAGLNELWYAQYQRTGLRSFDDSGEWMQMDKAGHAFTTYQLTSGLYDASAWAGWSSRHAMWIAAGTTMSFMTAVELMDGTSQGWGFSWTDMISNTLGTSLFIAQQSVWKHQRVQLKFSYAHSDFAALNPSLLGRNFQQRLIKDYNGQTYWCSFNIHRFLASDATFPKWLNVALGYGATGMTRAEMNEFDVNNFRRGREYYFSFDADLNRVQWPKKWMKVTARIISFIKLPGPTLQVQSDGRVKVYALFF